MDKVNEDPATRGASKLAETKFVLDVFGLGSVPLTEGSILDPCQEIGQ
jgi:hypothetical protein